MIDTVIFDLFGTLIHLPRDTKPYLQLCRAIGQSNCIRESLIVNAPTLADFCDHLDVSRPSNLTDIQLDLDTDINHAEVFSDSIETLRSLRANGMRIALISNLATPYKRAVVRLNLASYFDAVFYSCDLGLVKPNPAIYYEALTQLKTTAKSTMMIGDNRRSDLEGSTAVGIRGLLIDRSRNSTGPSVLHTLTDIPAHLERQPDC